MNKYFGIALLLLGVSEILLCLECIHINHHMAALEKSPKVIYWRDSKGMMGWFAADGEGVSAEEVKNVMRHLYEFQLETNPDGGYGMSRSGGYIGTLAPGQSTNIHITIQNQTTNDETIKFPQHLPMPPSGGVISN